MKRHPDLEREILLAVEAADNFEGDAVDLSCIEGCSEAEKGYHSLLLFEEGLIDAIPYKRKGFPYDYRLIRLTMKGHQYLDTIRDPEIWRKTKESAEKAGSFSLEVLSAIAKGFIREQVKKLSGVDVNL